MKYLSPLLSDARASIGGATASKNRAGNYFRARIAPTQPRTPNQQFVRSTLATLAAAWRGLTADQIAGWNALASTITKKDTLGNSYKPTGEQLFVGNNAALTNTGESTITNPPTSAPSFPGPVSLSATATAGTPSFAVDSGLTAAPTGYVFVVRATPQLSAGISFISQSRYRTVGAFPDTAFASINALASYNALFGALVAGATIGVELRLLHVASGFQSTAASAVITVGA